MARILHLIEGLSYGGAARGVFAAAKFSRRLAGHQHAIMPIAVDKCDMRAKELADEAGVEVIVPSSREEKMRHIEAADIVQLNWWNSPDVDAFLRSPLPAMRLIGWLHVGGHVAPQVVLPELLDFLDVVIPTSPHAMLAPAIQELPAVVQREKVVLAYGPADFSRLEGLTPKAHTGFNVGYIGTISFMKMHPDFVKMSAAVDIPDVRFIVCGSGGCEQQIVEQAQALGAADRFDVRGYVQDIRPILETMDAYGYPLCEDTYASSELNLQEVMYAGIPPVVFPSGGVKHLVLNNVTGYVATNAAEYKQALEHLYHNPAERARIGSAARQYATKIFGAENAALSLNRVYDQLMSRPKRTRHWTRDIPQGPNFGAEVLANSLGRTQAGDDFLQSLRGRDLEKILAADRRIAKSSDLLRSSGIIQYLRYYPNDSYLHFWAALTCLYRDEYSSASGHFLKAAQLGFEHWRVLWYLSMSAEKAGEAQLARQCAEAVESAAPGFCNSHSVEF